MNQVNVLLVEIPRELAQNWGWFLALGVGLGVLGVLGIVYSIRATVASMYFFGGVLVAAAGIECVNAVMVGRWSGFFSPPARRFALWRHGLSPAEIPGNRR
jgi:uncharacterized membrane protein HdeD (DUF308 family)